MRWKEEDLQKKKISKKNIMNTASNPSGISSASLNKSKSVKDAKNLKTPIAIIKRGKVTLYDLFLEDANQAAKESSRRSHDEDDEQAAFFARLALEMPEIREITFAIPNGGKRMIREAARLKKQGVTPGVPDILCALPVGYKHHYLGEGWEYFVYAGLFIEMKSTDKKKAKVSKLQCDKMKALSLAGYKCVVAYGAIEAMEYLKDYIHKAPDITGITKHDFLAKYVIRLKKEDNFAEEFEWKKSINDLQKID